MARSMTGFGRAALSVDGRELTLELKSVNHRFLDISFRMPRSLSFLEDTVRSALGSLLSRGHIDVYAYYRNTRSDAKSVSVDKALLGAYLAAAADVANEFSLANDYTVSKALRVPDIVTVTEAEEDTDALKALMISAVDAAAHELIEMRALEGERISRDLLTRLDTLSAIRDRIAEKAPLVVEDYRAKLNSRIESLLSEVEIDRARLATEIAIFADKANIDEELVRLSSHFAAMRALFEGDEPVGRKLDFLVQEMNREFNTIGSKANDKAIAALVIDGKAEIEKLREQVQNLE
ncbi:MAG: YicC family protein [Clostridia bacterium]|nr:YicC family protein [Clostridia bacterium]MBQ5487346.1 YicC family protein [Clostridia bacterium]